MTIKEVLKEITSKPKWYLYAEPEALKQSTATMTYRRIIRGTNHPRTVKKFLKAFGYDVELEYKITKNKCT